VRKIVHFLSMLVALIALLLLALPAKADAGAVYAIRSSQ
jgi:hypothetical protein